MIYVLICIYTHVGQFFLYAVCMVLKYLYIYILYIFRNTKIYIYIYISLYKCINIERERA